MNVGTRSSCLCSLCSDLNLCLGILYLGVVGMKGLGRSIGPWAAPKDVKAPEDVK